MELVFRCCLRNLARRREVLRLNSCLCNGGTVSFVCSIFFWFFLAIYFIFLLLVSMYCEITRNYNQRKDSIWYNMILNQFQIIYFLRKRDSLIYYEYYNHEFWYNQIILVSKIHTAKFILRNYFQSQYCFKNLFGEKPSLQYGLEFLVKVIYNKV